MNENPVPTSSPTCSRCGKPVPGRRNSPAPCPACLTGAARLEIGQDLFVSESWERLAETFPHLEFQHREDSESSSGPPVLRATTYSDRTPVAVQIVPHGVLGVTAEDLSARVTRLKAIQHPNLARILDFGDLDDGFYLITEAPDSEVSRGDLQIDDWVAPVADALNSARSVGVSLRFDPSWAWTDEQLRPAFVPLLDTGTGESNSRNLSPPENDLYESAFPTLEPGQQIGAFRLIDLLGEGGFSEVWLAEQSEPVRRKVALKFLKVGMDTRRLLARFEAEQQALARLDHPHIARVFDAGATEWGRPFFVMEPVDGRRLTDYCEEENLSISDRLRLFIRVCEATHHAHQKGIIHRDLKPANILVVHGEDGEGSPKIIDFGIAKAMSEPLTDQTIYTRDDQLLGTLEYMSPEQATRGNEEVDTATDIYALGAILYEVLVGRPPFSRSDQSVESVRRQVVEEEPIRPSRCPEADSSRLASQLRGDLDWIVMRCLEKDPARRYGSASALAKDIARHLGHEPVEACPPEIRYRMRKFVRRHRTSLAFASVLLLALLGGLIASTTMFVREKEARSATDLALEQAKHKLYVADLSSARQNWEDGRIAPYWDLLQKHIPAEGEEDRRGWEWYYLRSLVEWHEGEIQLHADDSCEVVVLSPDGRRLASGSASGAIVIYDLAEARLIVEFEAHQAEVTSLSWDPLGGRLASAGRDGRILMWDLDDSPEALFSVMDDSGDSNNRALVEFSPDGELLATGTRREGKQHVTIRSARDSAVSSSWKIGRLAKAFSWSPTGDRLAIVHGNHDLKASVWEVDSGVFVTELIERQIPRNGSASIAWSPDGRHLAMVRNRIWIYDTETWKSTIRELLPGSFCAPNGVAWSADSRRFAAIHEDRSIRIWDVEAKQELRRFHGAMKEGWEFTSLAWHPDYDLLIAGCSDGTARIWNASRTEAELTIPFLHGVAGLDWSTEGSRLAVVSEVAPAGQGEAVVSNCSLFSPENLELKHLGTPVQLWGVAWSPAQARCAAIDIQGTVTIWDGATGERLTSFPTGSGKSFAARGLAWSSDGKQIATVYPGHEILVWEAATGQQAFALPGKNASVAWSPDGRFLLTGSADGAIELWTVEGKRLSKLPAPKGYREGIGQVAWSPESQRFSATGSGRATTWNLGRDGKSPVLDLELPGVHYVDWHPTGDRLALANGDGSIRIANSRTGDELLTISAHGVGSPAQKMAWSPDGRRLASAYFNEAIVRISDASPGYPDRADQQWIPGQFPRGVGNLANHRDRIEKARADYERTMQVSVSILNGTTRARSLLEAERSAEAIELLEESLVLGKQSLEASAPVLISARNELEKSLRHLSRYEDALDACEERLSILQNAMPADREQLLRCKQDRGYLLIRSGRSREGIEILRDLIAEMKQQPNGSIDLIDLAKADQGEGHMHVGEFAEAAVLFESLIAGWERAGTVDENLDSFGWGSLALCYSKMDRHDDAVALTRKKIELLEGAFGPDNREILASNYSLAAYSSRAGRNSDVVEVLDGLLKRLPDEIEHPSRAHIMGRLAEAHRALGHSTEYERLSRERSAMLTQRLDTNYRERLGDFGADARVLVAPEASWRWLDSGDRSEPGETLFATFHHPNFDASSWKIAHDSVLGGFGEEEFLGQWPEGIHLGAHGPGHDPDVSLFRTKFSTTEHFDHLELHLQYDDGVVIFLDGKEVARENVRRGPVSASLHANKCRNHAKEFEVTRISLAGSLEPGDHVLAISLHNHDCWNHDLRMAGVRLVAGNGDRPENPKKKTGKLNLAELLRPRHILVSSDSRWSWLHPVDGVDPASSDTDFHKKFFRPDFDDTSWATGRDSGGADGGFGYGDERPNLVDIGTPREKSLGKSAYFRHRFTTTEEHTNLVLRCQRDDGIIVYLDGREVARHNMTEGEEAYELPAHTSVYSSGESFSHRIPLPNINLLPGKHILAISVHNVQEPSSDLRIGEITLVGVEKN